jgi:hypothetical protein
MAASSMAPDAPAARSIAKTADLAGPEAMKSHDAAKAAFN